MATYRILIVDDHREVRSSYRANISLLDANIKITDVPSGEEAILEASTYQIDLLIADVRLPGLSGLELLEKIKIYNPDMKVILVTGMVDAETRRQVADAEADAFFLKPVEMADLLDAVERCLGLIDGNDSPLGNLTIEAEKHSVKKVSERLSGLRRELDAFSTVLLDDHGKILALAGGLPDAVEKSQVLPTMMATFSVVNKISHFLGKFPPKDLWYFSGTKYDLFFSHVGASHGLLVAANPVDGEKDLAEVISAVNLAGKDLVESLATMGLTTMEAGHIEDQPEDDLDFQSTALEDVGELNEVFQDGSGVVTDELDAYWDTLTNEEENTGPHNADSLSYDQARQLGLTPDDE